MDLIKRGLYIILVMAIVGFIVYKIYWKNNNVPTGEESLDQFPAEEDDSPDYEQRLNSIQSEIERSCDLEIKKCYQETKGLRELLLNKRIKASDVIDERHLLPEGIKIPKENLRPSNPVESDVSKTRQGACRVTEINRAITELPDYFGNSIARPSVPTSDSWGKK
jgi:hypothetical protein